MTQAKRRKRKVPRNSSILAAVVLVPVILPKHSGLPRSLAVMSVGCCDNVVMVWECMG